MINSAQVTRRKKAVESFTSAKETIGELSFGMGLFAVTRGQFSMIDIILYLLSCMGHSKISVWTWAIADYEVEVFSGLMQRKEIDAALLIVDYSAGKRNADLLNQWREIYGNDSVKICMNHAKIARVMNDDYKFLIRGSMNLNFNPRFEQFDLTEGGDDFRLVEQIENELEILPINHSKKNAQVVTKLGSAFDLKTLNIFDVSGSWKP